MKNNILLILIFIIFFVSNNAFCAQNEGLNDYLYSAEYFDYLIECAEIEQEKIKEKENKTDEELVLFFDEDIVFENNNPLKLKIEKTNITPYSETFIKENSKTIIPVGEKFSFIQDMLKTRNKYSSHDYKILAGVEIKPFKFFNLASGLETNYRGIDQNPSSRKLYLTPNFYITDKLSLSFPNKINVSSHSIDHDVGLKISPFKSKFLDFGVYAGLTKTQTGKQTESVNFTTNFYFY